MLVLYFLRNELNLMQNKGGVSFPIVLVVTLIIVAIVIALAYIFLFNTKVRIEDAFGDLTKSITSFSCSLLGPVRGFICPGG